MDEEQFCHFSKCITNKENIKLEIGAEKSVERKISIKVVIKNMTQQTVGKLEYRSLNYTRSQRKKEKKNIESWFLPAESADNITQVEDMSGVI